MTRMMVEGAIDVCCLTMAADRFDVVVSVLIDVGFDCCYHSCYRHYLYSP